MIHLQYHERLADMASHVDHFMIANNKILSNSMMSLTRYQEGYDDVTGSNDFDPITIEPRAIRFGGSVLECYPFIIRKDRKATTKTQLYIRATSKLRDWDIWDEVRPGMLWICRNDKEHGPNRLLIEDGKIVEARLKGPIISLVNLKVNPRCYDSRGYWHPEYEYLVREKDYESLR